MFASINKIKVAFLFVTLISFSTFSCKNHTENAIDTRQAKKIAYLINTNNGDLVFCDINIDEFNNCNFLNSGNSAVDKKLKEIFTDYVSTVYYNEHIYVINEKSDTGDITEENKFYALSIEKNSRNLQIKKQFSQFKNPLGLTIHNNQLFVAHNPLEIGNIISYINLENIEDNPKPIKVKGLDSYNNYPHDGIYFYQNKIYLINRYSNSSTNNAKKNTENTYKFIVSCDFDDKSNIAINCKDFNNKVKYENINGKSALLNLDKIVINKNHIYSIATLGGNKGFVSNIKTNEANFIFSSYEKEYEPTDIAFINENTYVLNGKDPMLKCKANEGSGILEKCEKIYFYNTKISGKIFNKIIFVDI
ncbi:hypothetical protein [Fluviispira sanaruensis]|uniref:Lipoprotein n=1 Tax=Fluviispira sanaruensis TaxID=2493639 RepID=A0A4P2VJB4_FLUSA|nr:hypothetical protein [Fluviispira sanaruensis]BBH53226.1 hypothetical protein JCM31447_16690 [Fluviispira sanaruensis]